MATEAQLRYLINVQDQDLKAARKEIKGLHKDLSNDLPKASGRASAAMGGLGKAGGAAGLMLRGVGKAAAVSAVALGAGAAAGLAAVLKVGIGEFSETAKVGAQTNAVLKSTGGIAGVTATQVGGLAEALMRKSGVDDEAIQSGQNMLLTFTKIRNETGAGNDVFDQATRATLDLSVAMGKDMSSSAILVGKALNDPIKGVGALSKAGVQLTAVQKEQIAAFVESGNVMGAQKIILGELTTQFGGSAEALGNTLPGQINKAKQAFANLSGSLVGSLVPAFTSVLTTVNAHWPEIERIGRAVFGSLIVNGRAVVDFIRVHWTTIQTVATAVFEGVRGVWNGVLKPALASAIALAGDVVEALRRNWPQISATAVTVFEAVRNAWTNVLRPALSAVVGFLGDVARAAVEHWPKVRQAAESVALWYRQNLQPTVAAVITYLQQLWARYGEDVLTVAQRVFGTVAVVVRNGLTAVKAVIEGVLALIRGDWNTAWESLKTAVGAALRGVVALIKGFGGLFLDATTAIGRAIVDGIVAGIKAAPGAIADALGGVVDGALDSVKGKLGIGSPSKVFAIQVGVPIAQGMAQGILSGKVKVTDAMVQVANAALERARSAVQTSFGKFQAFAQRAFQAQQSSALTKTERLIAQIEGDREEGRRADAVTDARKAIADETKQLAAAQQALERAQGLAAALSTRPDVWAHESPEAREKRAAAAREAQEDVKQAKAAIKERQAEIVAATERLNEAQYEVRMAGLRKQAEGERRELDARQFVEQLNFDARMTSLQRYLESGEATAAGAKGRILDLMHDFGIELGDTGELVGRAFADGMRASIPHVVAAAKDMAASAKNQQIINTGAAITQRQMEAASKAAALKKKKGPLEIGDRAVMGGGGGGGAMLTSGGGQGSVTGDLDFSATLLSRLQALSAATGRAIYVQSGGRTMAEQWHLYNLWKAGKGNLAAYPDANAPHVRGIAADITPGREVFGSVASKFGLGFTVASEGWHIEALARGGILPGSLLGDRGAAARRSEAVLPLESAHGQRVLASAMAQALRESGVGRGGPQVYIAEQHNHSGLDAELVASSIGRKLATLL